jgi:hypothetical protein
VTINVTKGLAEWEPLLIVFHDAADIVSVLPDDVRAVSDLGGDCLSGEDQSDRWCLLRVFSWEAPFHKLMQSENRC